jgi:hypothetical protein
MLSHLLERKHLAPIKPGRARSRSHRESGGENPLSPDRKTMDSGTVNIKVIDRYLVTYSGLSDHDPPLSAPAGSC